MKAGNPQWIEILEIQKQKILDKTPDSNYAHSFTRAIKELKKTGERLDYPGQRVVKYLGPKLIAILKKELAKGPLGSDDSFPSSSGIGFDHIAPPPVRAKPGPKPRALKGKGKERAVEDYPDRGLHGTQQQQVPTIVTSGEPYKPGEGTAEYTLLLALYCQCDAYRQRLNLPGMAFPALVGPWIDPMMLAAAIRTCVHQGVFEVAAGDMYTLTWLGYRSAERCAVKHGIPRIQIIRDDFFGATAPALPKAAIMQPVQQAVTAQANSSSVPRKRKTSGLDEGYEGLGALSSEGSGHSLLGSSSVARPAMKKVVTGALASVYKAPLIKVAPPAADELPFLFSYLDEGNNRVEGREQAEISMQDQTDTDNVASTGSELSLQAGAVMYKVEFRSKQARHPLARLICDMTPLARTPVEPEGPTESGWILADKAVARCPGLTTAAVKAKKPAPPKVTGAKDDLMAGLKQKLKQDPRAMYKFPSLDTIGTSASSSPVKNDPLAYLRPPVVQSQPLKRSVSDSAAPPPEPFSYKSISLPTSTQPLSATSTARLAPNAHARPAMTQAGLGSGFAAPARPTINRSISSSFSIGVNEQAEYPTFEPIILPPGSFDVMLLIDHREIKGVSHILNTLERLGVPHLVTNLELGDFVWVARRRCLQGNNYDQIVLAICERKRMDDFVTSIKTERYRDQKQRIRQTGISKCFYLAEEYGSKNLSETFQKALCTSMSQTQVIDDFTLLVAVSPAETINHLIRVTRAFQEEGKALHVIPDAHVSPSSIAALQRHLGQISPEIAYHTSFSSFERISCKQFTLHSIWSKMACSMNGMSQELCVDFLDNFPTPIAFLADLESKLAFEDEHGRLVQCAEPIQKKKKLKETDVELYVKTVLDRGYQPRPMTNPASERIWHLYTKDSYGEV